MRSHELNVSFAPVDREGYTIEPQGKDGSVEIIERGDIAYVSLASTVFR